ITDRRIKEEQLFRLAHHDPLTELPNRSVLHRRVEQLNGGVEPAALLAIDLDGFKSVNDDLGHAAGDAVLREISRRLITCVRSTDTVARLGGDEFAILLPGVGDANQAGDVAQSTIQALSQPIELNGETVTVGASVGIALYVQDGSSSDELLSSADLALYEAKNHGRHCYRHYSPALRQATDRARAYDTELRRAYEDGEFEVFYQPQIRLSDSMLVGAEALLRWRHPRDGLLSPAAFLPGLENRPISTEVGQWVLQQACLQAACWRQVGVPEFRMGVNLFSSQFRTGNLVASVRTALQRANLPPSALELEITENIMLRHEQGIISPLCQLRNEGVQVAFDDYGTGYASLSMLKRFPLTRLKIDKSFVQGMCSSRQDAAVIRAVLLLGNAFGFSVIAEGVETEEQADRLRRKGCEEVQGYLFGRPMPASDFAAHFGFYSSGTPG
ncbi:MAG: EAL domain-containing protein, partial [Oxalobacteraceae bacterium]